MKVCSCAAPSASRPCEVGGSTAIKVSACLCYVTFEIGRCCWQVQVGAEEGVRSSSRRGLSIFEISKQVSKLFFWQYLTTVTACGTAGAAAGATAWCDSCARCARCARCALALFSRRRSLDLDITVFTFDSAFRDSLRLHACCFLGVVYYVLGPCCHSVLVHYTYSARAFQRFVDRVPVDR